MSRSWIEQSNPTLSPEQIAQHVGEQAFDRGAKYALTGHVKVLIWDEHTSTLRGRVEGNGPADYVTLARFSLDERGAVQTISSFCTCPMVSNCKHAAAVMFLSQIQSPSPESSSASSASSASTASWRAALAPLAHPITPAPTAVAPLALQFGLLPSLASRWSSQHTGQRPRLGARPMAMGKQGKWIKSQVTWSNLAYQRGAARAEQVRALTELLALHTASQSYHRLDVPWIDLERFPSRSLWDWLAKAEDAGLALIFDNPAQDRIALSPDPATVELDIERSSHGLTIEISLSLDGRVLEPGTYGFFGEAAHGLFTWDVAATGSHTTPLVLAPLTEVLGAEICDLALADDLVVIPPGDEADFIAEVYPQLAQHLPITSRDGTFQPPGLPEPFLHLTLTHHPGAAIDLAWHWIYRTHSPVTDARRKPKHPVDEPRELWPTTDDTRYRDKPREAAILGSLAPMLENFPHLGRTTIGARRLSAGSALAGLETIAFITDELPLLMETEGLLVEVVGTAPQYREATDAPQILMRSRARPGTPDWFDLAVTVSIDGEDIAFDALFRALAGGDHVMILPSGTYFTLDRPELLELRRLIEEARSLQDSNSTTLSISRYQIDLWSELEQLGIISGQAAEWRKAVAGLAGGAPTAVTLPGTVHATLRGYQQSGFEWLAFLHDHGLGGILADDMGLGKTLQAIALIAHTRRDSASTSPSGPHPPFLVVAPTSVIPNWASECLKFTPDLRVVTINQTSAKRSVELASAVLDADIVITSYTLFRLDFQQYEDISWAGLFLDEAQFVKNHQSRAHQCARRLSVPFKIAITGTPMENNLMELWSLLSITSPGLFTSPSRFAEYYQRSIEKEGNADRLAQLRRRIRPFMLRRTKDEVASDLPEKQEQVLELELHPRHRKVYETHLQRERQKVLGLIDDMNANRFAIFRSLTMLRQLSLDASLFDEKYASIPSTKLDALMELLDDTVAEGHRTLVFSQFTKYLAKAKARLDAAGITYSYLDGRTRDRAKAIDDFKSGTTSVFLISLKAGGFGLNLTEADYVILLDPWWNPATEAQAVDRAHRIGQDKKVMVYRLVSKDTIEEKVMALKAGKAALFEAVMSGGEAATGALTASEIRELLT